MNTSITNSSVDTDTKYYYASEVTRNLRKAFLKAWGDEFTKKKDCEEPLDRQNMYVFLLVPATKGSVRFGPLFVRRYIWCADLSVF